MTRIYKPVLNRGMAAAIVQKTLRNKDSKLKIVSSKPVVNEDKKGFLNIFKSFLAVGGDFV